eukprot:6178734-Pleurochrysis_carterae.AAC.2
MRRAHASLRVSSRFAPARLERPRELAQREVLLVHVHKGLAHLRGEGGQSVEARVTERAEGVDAVRDERADK